MVIPVLACVQVDLSGQPPAQVMVVITATPDAAPATPIVWPTLAPRPTPPALLPVAYPAPAPTCRQPNLPVDTHLSGSGSYTITESIEVGWMQCHIQPGSCAYDSLVGYYDPRIVYKREEIAPFDAEDMLLHPAMLQPLARLNELVLAEWNGAVQLRITDAYDSLLSHDPPGSEPARRYSLHYEGRALDFTTYPVDRSQYGRLCALALCAGFDWVHNEGTHCHASVNAPSLCEQCSR